MAYLCRLSSESKGRFSTFFMDVLIHSMNRDNFSRRLPSGKIGHLWDRNLFKCLDQISTWQFPVGNTKYKEYDYGLHMYVGCTINLEHILIFKRADMLELFQYIKQFYGCFPVFRGWMGHSTAHLRKMQNQQTSYLDWCLCLCLLLILSWFVHNLSGLLLSSCSRNFPLNVSGVLLVAVQLLPVLEVASTDSTDHSVVDLKAALVSGWTYGILCWRPILGSKIWSIWQDLSSSVAPCRRAIKLADSLLCSTQKGNKTGQSLPLTRHVSEKWKYLTDFEFFCSLHKEQTLPSIEGGISMQVLF